MANVLILSSQVARGHVGGSTTRLVLEALGHEAWLVPTILLSNHPAHAAVAGEPVPARQIGGMVEALDANGWLGALDAVFTGYMPTPEHVREAAAAIRLVCERNAAVRICCDPILGDDPGGLYVSKASARALAEELVPLAHVVTPNRFELEWLAGLPVRSISDALAAAGSLADQVTVATSIPGENVAVLHNVLAAPGLGLESAHDKRSDAPHGTGDLMAALFAGRRLLGDDLHTAFARAGGAVEAMLADHHGGDDFALAGERQRWLNAAPCPVRAVRPATET
ncbi:MAG: pyridoxal kinase PdxY [Methyloligellaceae bacterium]